jgi:hypothetical protein
MLHLGKGVAGLLERAFHLPPLAAVQRRVAPQPLELDADRRLQAKELAFADEAVHAVPVATRAAGWFVVVAVPLAVAEQEAVKEPLELVAASGAFVNLLGEGREVGHGSGAARLLESERPA